MAAVASGESSKESDDLPALPPARRGAQARGGGTTEGAGHNYLIQHSAGSGKTNSISWLSHRLASLHDDADQKVFDCVIVVTDRRVLDRATPGCDLPDRARAGCRQGDRPGFKAARGGTDRRHKDRHHDLAEISLRAARFAARAGAESSGKSHRGREAAGEGVAGGYRRAKVRRHCGRGAFEPNRRDSARTEGDPGCDRHREGEDEADWEDGLNQVMQSRGRQPNLSFFAFTATPKGKTLELFGRPGPSGTSRSLPHLQHASGDRGEIHPRRPDQLHDLRHLLPAAQSGRGRSQPAEKAGDAGTRQVHEPSPA